MSRLPYRKPMLRHSRWWLNTTQQGPQQIEGIVGKRVEAGIEHGTIVAGRRRRLKDGGSSTCTAGDGFASAFRSGDKSRSVNMLEKADLN